MWFDCDPTVIDPEDWMKSFFENNRAYFEKQGLAQKLKKAQPGTAGWVLCS